MLNSLFVHTLVSQTLLQQIEDAYNSLDSIFYIENVISSYREKKEKECKETDNLLLEMRGFDYNNLNFNQRQNDLDSIYGKMTHSNAYNQLHWSLKDPVGWFASNIRDKPVHYVLNLKIDTCGKLTCLLPDTSSLTFNLFYFGKDYKDGFYVYCEEGQYSWSDSRYRTFSKKIGKNAKKVFKKILRKKPKYLLYCSELEGMNTVLYVLNDEIYVYRIIQMKEYKLDDYIRKFT